LDVAIFEQDAAAVRVGTPARSPWTPSPDERFAAVLTFIYPQLDEKTAR